MKIKNTWSNHTGLAAMNLWLNNVYVMYKCDIRKDGRPYAGWRKGTWQLVQAALLGWFKPHAIRSCRLVRR